MALTVYCLARGGGMPDTDHATEPRKASPAADPKSSTVPSGPHGAIGPVAAEERITLDSARTTERFLSLPDLDLGDRDRVRCVIGVLEDAGKARLPDDIAVRESDLPAFRSIIDNANKNVDRADSAWHEVARKRTRQMEEQLLADIGAGVPPRYPLATPQNVQRRHPSEAVTTTICEQGRFVLRVGVDEEPGLLAAGERIAECRRDRIMDFDSLIRELLTKRSDR